MNQFIAMCSVMLFCAFFEVSGGEDFTPAPQNAATSSTQLNRSAYAKAYVPFDEPIIHAAPVQTALIQDVLPAAMTHVAKTADIRAISGQNVNVRQGPNTSFAVIATVQRGTEAEVLAMNDDWAQIRLLQTDQVAWVAGWLLSD